MHYALIAWWRSTRWRGSGRAEASSRSLAPHFRPYQQLEHVQTGQSLLCDQGEGLPNRLPPQQCTRSKWRGLALQVVEVHHPKRRSRAGLYSLWTAIPLPTGRTMACRRRSYVSAANRLARSLALRTSCYGSSRMSGRAPYSWVGTRSTSRPTGIRRSPRIKAVAISTRNCSTSLTCCLFLSLVAASRTQRRRGTRRTISLPPR